MTNPTLGAIELVHILSWNESKVSHVPKKEVLNKSTPTVETGTYITSPRMIIIVCRVSSAEKVSLYAIEHTTVTLTDETGTPIDSVFFESVSFKYDYKKDDNATVRPWVAELHLVCTTK